jgi:hypothetical protein
MEEQPTVTTTTPRHVLVPTVIEEGNRGDRAFDIYSQLLRERIVFLGQEVDDQVANLIISQMLFLEAQNSERDIYLYINSPGGVAYAGMAIYDVGHGNVGGRHDPVGRSRREALLPAQRAHHDPPGLGRHPRRALRHGDPAA